MNKHERRRQSKQAMRARRDRKPDYTSIGLEAWNKILDGREKFVRLHPPKPEEGDALVLVETASLKPELRTTKGGRKSRRVRRYQWVKP